MQVFTLPLGKLAANCYLLLGDDGAAAVIDPGLYTKELTDLICNCDADVQQILLTHGHADHISGAKALRDATGAPVCIHTLDDKYTDSPLNMAEECGYSAAPFRADRLLHDGDTVSFGSEQVTVLHTPGHSPGSVCFLHSGERLLFSGDTLFCMTAGRTDFYGGSYEQMMHSLRRLRDLDGDYTVYPGHERATLLSRERTRNIFMRRLDR